MNRLSQQQFFAGWASLMLLVLTASQGAAQGLTVTGVGPVNRSMGGAGTAAPLDAIGALHWNPASISALPCGEVSFGFESLISDIDLQTSIGGVDAKTSGEPGFAVIPSVGWVQPIADTPFTIGLGMYGIAGFRNNLPRDPNSPLLANRPAYADAELLQLAPTVSWQVNDQLSIGFAPTITAGRIMLDPLGPSVVTPTPTDGSGNRVHWGGGFQVGIYYEPTESWHFGFSFKSQQWFEDFRFFTPDGVVKFDLDYPMILSFGVAYSGWENWIFAVDTRFFNYDSTPGFNQLGFSNIFAGALGAQYTWREVWKFRAGYNFNQDPLHSSDAVTNLISPLIQNQNLACGVARQFGEQVEISLAYIYLVENDLTGPLPAPFVPGDTVTHEISAHSISLGVRVLY